MRKLKSILFLVLLWIILASYIDNSFLIPYPTEVIKTMWTQLFDSKFYTTVMITIVRSVKGLLLAFVTAFICSFASFRSKLFHDLFYPILLLVRSVPNVAYIIIILVWFGSERSASIVSFLIIFPTIFSTLYHGFCNLNDSLTKVIQLYPERFLYKIIHVYIPMLSTEIQSSLSNGLSLTFKVGVMAEILGQVQVGIGRQLHLCRVVSDVTGIFAWTFWIILILLLMDWLLSYIFILVKK